MTAPADSGSQTQPAHAPGCVCALLSPSPAGVAAGQALPLRCRAERPLSSPSAAGGRPGWLRPCLHGQGRVCCQRLGLQACMQGFLRGYSLGVQGLQQLIGWPAACNGVLPGQGRPVQARASLGAGSRRARCQVEAFETKHQLSKQPGRPSELRVLMLGATGTAQVGSSRSRPPGMAHTLT